MDLSIEKNGDATVIRIQTARVIYPLLPTLVGKTREAVEKGARSLLLAGARQMAGWRRPLWGRPL